MLQKATCLQTYIPMRSEPRSGAEMVSSLLFGESCDVLEGKDGWAHIRTVYDQYEGWVNADSLSSYQQFDEVNDSLFTIAQGSKQRILVPCGAGVPSSGLFLVGDEKFTIEKKVKTSHHLPLPLRLCNSAQLFLNTPYLWGGRCFMGIDCSGFVQVVYKACGIVLPRDSSQQAREGKEVSFMDIKPCDLVFFSKPEASNVTHVGFMLDSENMIHASGKVRIDTLTEEGIYFDQALKYKIVAVKRFI